MSEKRMLILPAELVKKIDENRGDMAQAEFIDFLIESRLQKADNSHGQFVSLEEFQAFEHGMKDLFRSFLDFFISFGLEMGYGQPKGDLQGLEQKLHSLEETLESDKDERRAKIKWK